MRTRHRVTECGGVGKRPIRDYEGIIKGGMRGSPRFGCETIDCARRGASLVRWRYAARSDTVALRGAMRPMTVDVATPAQPLDHAGVALTLYLSGES